MAAACGNGLGESFQGRGLVVEHRRGVVGDQKIAMRKFDSVGLAGFRSDIHLAPRAEAPIGIPDLRGLGFPTRLSLPPDGQGDGKDHKGDADDGQQPERDRRVRARRLQHAADEEEQGDVADQHHRATDEQHVPVPIGHSITPHQFGTVDRPCIGVVDHFATSPGQGVP